MPSFSLLQKFALLSFAIRTAAAATCEVAGGTSDDGPAIKAALAICNNGGTILLDKTYTIGTVLETTTLSNVAIELTGTIILSPGMYFSMPEYDRRILTDCTRNIILEGKRGSSNLPKCIYRMDNWRFWDPHLWRWNIQWQR
jgi:hypothetical protein